jgi:hypothetical protein
MDIRQLFADSPGQHVELHSNPSADLQLEPDSDPNQAADMVPDETFSDDEEDKTYRAEPDFSGNSSNNELDENESSLAVSKALSRAQEAIGIHYRVSFCHKIGPLHFFPLNEIYLNRIL